MRKDRPKQGLTVMVRGNDWKGAMEVVKKRMQGECIFNEIRERVGHKTRGEKKRLQRAAGRKRWLKKVDKLKEQGLWNE